MRYNEMMVKRIVLFLALLMIGLVSSRALLNGKVFFTHDFVHVARIAEMQRGLQAGDFPVQWSQNFGYGYGMPLFLFYGPLPYYVGAVLYLGLNNATWAYLALFLIANGVTLWGAYKLGKELSGILGGVLLAVLLTMAPYRAVNLFVRGAVSELWGMMFLPWLVWGWVLVAKKKPWGWLTITLSTAGILLSHNLSALTLLPTALICGIAVYFWLGSSKKKQSIHSFWRWLVQGFLAQLLGIALSAFYFIPAFLEKSETKLSDLILTGYFDYHNHFLYLRQFFQDKWTYGGSEWGPNDGISFFLGYGTLLAVVLFAVYAYREFRRNKLSRRLLVSSGCLLFALLLMLLTTQKTLWFWERLPLLNYLQFPWRLLSSIGFVLALLGTLVTTSLGQKSKYFVLAIFVVTTFSSWRYFQPESYLDDANALFYTDAGRIQVEMSGILPDYIPRDVADSLNPPGALVLSTSKVVTEILKNDPSEKLLTTESNKPTSVSLAMADFPGWRAYLDGTAVAHQTSTDGLIDVALPEGKHLLSLKFAATPLRRVANTISFIAVCILVGMLYNTTKKSDEK